MVILSLVAVVLFVPSVTAVFSLRHYHLKGVARWESLIKAAATTAKIGSVLVLVGSLAIGLYGDRLQAGAVTGVFGGILIFVCFRILARLLKFAARKFSGAFETIDKLVGPGSAIGQITNELQKADDGKDPHALEFDDDAMNFQILLTILFSLVIFLIWRNNYGVMYGAALVVQLIGCVTGAVFLTAVTWRLAPENLKLLLTIAMWMWPVVIILLFFVVSSLK